MAGIYGDSAEDRYFEKKLMEYQSQALNCIDCGRIMDAEDGTPCGLCEELCCPSCIEGFTRCGGCCE